MIIRDAEGHTHEVTNGQHLGDGCYVWHDGFQFWIGAERSSGWHVVALEDSVLSALIAYARRIYETRSKK
jgi:hypothetical protein